MTRGPLRDQELASFFEREGFAELPALSPAEVAKLKAHMAELRPADGFAPTDTFHCSFLDASRDYKRRAFELVRDAFAPFVERVLADYTVLVANFYVKPGNTGKLELHQNWPVLDLDETSVTIWCPLVDCDVANGTLHVVPRSHKLVPHVEGPRTEAYFNPGRSDIERRLAKPLPTKAGDAVIFDDSLVHGSPRNMSSDPRVAVQLICVPSDAQAIFYFDDGANGFDRIAIDEDFFLDHSPEMLNSRHSNWRSLGRMPNRNHLVGSREFERLLRKRGLTVPQAGGRWRQGFSRLKSIVRSRSA